MLMLTDRVDDELLDAAGPQLRVVANYAVGVNNVDVEACRRRGVVVANTPDVLTETTAELTIALMLALLRRVVEGDRLIRRGEDWIWAPNLMLGHSLRGLTLGLVGHGRIGRAVERLGEAHGMRVGHSSRTGGIPLDELLATSDVVSLHLPLTEETRHLIDAAALATDEADRGARQHEPRADRRRGGARRGAARRANRRSGAGRLRARAARCTRACSSSRTSCSCPTSARRPRRRARRWGCSASRRCGRCCSRNRVPANVV